MERPTFRIPPSFPHPLFASFALFAPLRFNPFLRCYSGADERILLGSMTIVTHAAATRPQDSSVRAA
jgi:hypothetical protein